MNAKNEQFNIFEEGGDLSSSGLALDRCEAAAKSAQLGFFEVQVGRAKSKSAVLKSIARTLDFPEHFGSNLDALYDCLTDMVVEHPKGLCVVLRGLHTREPALGEHVPALRQVLEDAAAFARERQRCFTFYIEELDAMVEPLEP